MFKKLFKTDQQIVNNSNKRKNSKDINIINKVINTDKITKNPLNTILKGYFNIITAFITIAI